MQIYIARGGQTYGPYNVDEANAHLASGHLIASDLAWFQGCATWLPLTQVAGVQVPPGSVPPPAPALPNFAPQPGVLQSAAPLDEQVVFEISPTLTPHIALCVFTLGLWLIVLVPVALVNTSNRYRLTTQRLVVRRGAAALRVDEVELYRVRNVTVEQSFLGRLLGFGTVEVHGNDASTPKLRLAVNSPLRVKEQIRQHARASRRTEGVRSIEYGAAG